jgi:hypothetical protein
MCAFYPAAALMGLRSEPLLSALEPDGAYALQNSPHQSPLPFSITVTEKRINRSP